MKVRKRRTRRQPSHCNLPKSPPDWDKIVARAVKHSLPGKTRFVLREKDLPPGFNLRDGQIAPGVRVWRPLHGDEIVPGVYAIDPNPIRRAIAPVRRWIRAMLQKRGY